MLGLYLKTMIVMILITTVMIVAKIINVEYLDLLDDPGPSKLPP